jgi:hypothetical protein
MCCSAVWSEELLKIKKAFRCKTIYLAKSFSHIFSFQYVFNDFRFLRYSYTYMWSISSAKKR